MLHRILQTAVLIAIFGCTAAVSAPVYGVPPGPIGGEAGTTIGWGFSITNDTGFYLLVDSSQFCQIGQDPNFTTCTQTQGTYNDLIASDLTVINPNSTLTQSYDLSAPSGLGSYTINAGAPLFAIDTGVIVLTYIEFSGNPLTTGTPVSGDIELGLNDLPNGGSSGAAQVEVTPEPGSFVLLGLGLAGSAMIRRARHR